MKSTINISICGVAFTLENDAYDTLNNYMKQVERAYKSESSSTEITSDIEARISELVLSWQSEHSTIVTKECIDAIITQMGIPEEPTVTPPTAEYTPNNERQTTTRRLYRNSQGSRLGGVLNGIATYFNIDVTMLRIAISVLFTVCIFLGHTQGTTLPLIVISYVILWIIVPVAKNARQKMEMQGEPITIETLSSNIKEELNSISPNNKNEKTASIFTNMLYAIGKVIRFIFMFFAIIVGISVLAVIVSTILAGCAILFKGQNFIQLFLDTNPALATILALICVLTPLLIIMYSIIKMFFSLQWNKGILISLFSLWIISWAVGTYIFTSNAYEYSKDNYTDEKKLYALKSDTLTIIPTGDSNTNNHYSMFESEDWRAGIIKRHVDFNITENSDLAKSEVRIKVRRKSHGSSFDEVIKYCEEIEFNYTLKNDTLSFPNILTYKAPTKYRFQEVDFNVEIAPGTNIIIPENYYNHNKWRVFNNLDYDFDINLNDNNVYIKSKILQPHTDTLNNSNESTNKEIKDDGKTKVEVVSIKNGKLVTTIK